LIFNCFRFQTENRAAESERSAAKLQRDVNRLEGDRILPYELSLLRFQYNIIISLLFLLSSKIRIYVVTVVYVQFSVSIDEASVKQ